MKLKSLVLTGLVAVAASALVSSVAQRSMSGRVSASAAPEFALANVSTASGGEASAKPVSLQGALSGKKAVLLNFWFAACPPCRDEMPHLQKIYEQYQPRGLEIVGVNATDTAPEIQAFGREFGLGFPLALDAERKATSDYKVLATPTNILIDERGNVIWRSEGFDEAGLKQILDETLPSST